MGQFLKVNKRRQQMTNKTKQESIAILTKALEEAKEMMAKEIKTKFNKDLPPLQVVIARDESETKHGHFTLWTPWVSEDKAYHEIFLSGQSLARGAVATFGTLAHEMTHAVNFKDGVDGVTGDGYHNKKFADMGNTLFGLEFEKVKGIGFSKTSVPTKAQKQWAKVIDKIAEGLSLSAMDFGQSTRKPGGETPKGGEAPKGFVPKPKGRNKNNPLAKCECGEGIRMSQRVLEKCRPMCQNCKQEFKVRD
jgi:hypothetical protein